MPGQLAHRQWRYLRDALKAARPPVCNLCGDPINMRLSGMHPDGPNVDHIFPISKGGAMYDPANCALTHRRCNLAKGNRTPTSRQW